MAGMILWIVCVPKNRDIRFGRATCTIHSISTQTRPVRKESNILKSSQEFTVLIYILYLIEKHKDLLVFCNLFIRQLPFLLHVTKKHEELVLILTDYGVFRIQNLKNLNFISLATVNHKFLNRCQNWN